MKAVVIVLGASLLGGCLLEKSTEPGFCGSDRPCPAGYECSSESGPTWRMCICASASCADGGVDSAPGDASLDGAGGDTGGDLPGGDLSPDAAACTSDKDCSGVRPFCGAEGACVACLGDGDCKAASASFCVSGACVGCASAPAGACAKRSASAAACGPAGVCVECVASTDCTADVARPICTPSFACAPCTTDAQCAAKPGPGVCMSHQDGRCASAAETMYVRSAAGCATVPPGGTEAKPYCGAQAAIDEVGAGKRVIVVTGPAEVGGFQWNASGAGAAQVTVVGRMDAALSGGGPVVAVSGGDLFMRNVTVRSSTDAGVVAEMGGTLRLHEATIQGNAKGGIRVVGAGFEIVNCVIANNSVGGVGASSFAGAYLGAAPVGAPHAFAFNTVADNKHNGVVCEGATQVVDALQLWNNTGADAFNCMVTRSKTSADPDPKFGASYRLTAMSPCRNAATPAPVGAPGIDIDGITRPQEGVFDCGASEWKP